MHDPQSRCQYCCKTHLYSVNAEKCRHIHEARWARAKAAREQIEQIKSRYEPVTFTETEQ
jgi:hypothetical protein